MLWPTPALHSSSVGPSYQGGWMGNFLPFKKELFPEKFAFTKTEIVVMRQRRRKFETVETSTSTIFPVRHIVNWDTVGMEEE